MSQLSDCRQHRLFWPVTDDTACLLLNKARQLGYDKHLMLFHPQPMDLTGLTPIYQSVLKAVQALSSKHKAATTPWTWIFEQILFGNSLREAGIVKRGHLLKTLYRPAHHQVQQKGGLCFSARIPQSQLPWILLHLIMNASIFFSPWLSVQLWDSGSLGSMACCP